MPIPAVLDTLDAMPENLQDSYAQGPDGKYHLSDVPGMVEKKRVDEFRENNRTLQSQLDELASQMELYKDVDLDELKALKEQERKIMEKELIDKGEIDTIIEQRMKPVVTAKDAEYAKLQKSYDAAEAQLGVLLIDNQTAQLATQLGVEPDALVDLTGRARNQFRIKNGKAVAIDDEGNQVYGPDGITPLELDKAWMEGVKKTAPHLFRPANGTGATDGSGNRGRGATDTSKLSSMQKIALGLDERNTA